MIFMCKYCKLEDREFEAYNDVNSIAEVKDGTQSFALYLNRYIDKRKRNSHRKELALELSVNVGNNESYTIKEKHIKIKYCPFCGEEL